MGVHVLGVGLFGKPVVVMTHGRFHRDLVRLLFVLLLHCRTPLVPIVLEGQRDQTQTNPDGDHQEHTADILNTDPVTLVFYLWTLFPVKFPPECLQIL